MLHVRFKWKIYCLLPAGISARPFTSPRPLSLLFFLFPVTRLHTASATSFTTIENCWWLFPAGGWSRLHDKASWWKYADISMLIFLTKVSCSNNTNVDCTSYKLRLLLCMQNVLCRSYWFFWENLFFNVKEISFFSLCTPSFSLNSSGNIKW